MLGSNLLRAVITTVVAALVLGSRIELWHLVLAGALFGTVDAVFFPAINTIVARLVPEDRLGPANALLQGTHQLMHTVGPAIAGFAIAIIGIGAAFAIDAASFVVAAVAVWLVAGVRSGTAPSAAPPPADTEVPLHPANSTADLAPAPAPEAGEHGSMVASMVEGGRVVLGDPMMRMIVLLSTAFNVAFTGPIVVGLPWLVQVRFLGDSAPARPALRGIRRGIGHRRGPRRYAAADPAASEACFVVFATEPWGRPRGDRSRVGTDRRR